MKAFTSTYCLPTMKSLALTTVLLGSTAVNAAVFYDNSVVDKVAGLTTSSTTGADMNGMTVHAVFANGTNQTLTWAGSGVSSGGVNGASWSLVLTGDSYVTSWSFANATGSNLTMLELDGSNGLTVFDTKFGGVVGTANSDFGKTFLANTSLPYNATYSNVVGIGEAPPVTDIYHKLSIDFTPGGIGGNWVFMQDTDNVSVVPLPAAVWFFGSGLLGLAGFARRSSSAFV